MQQLVPLKCDFLVSSGPLVNKALTKAISKVSYCSKIVSQDAYLLVFPCAVSIDAEACIQLYNTSRRCVAGIVAMKCTENVGGVALAMLPSL